MVTRYRNRHDAGERLAAELRQYANHPNLIVLALPRGGVPVGYAVARALGAPLDVFVVRKLGIPWHEELAMGAIASGGVRVLDEHLIRAANVSANDLERVTATELAELERRERRYRGDRPFPDLTGKTVLLVDDGLATGATMTAAAAAVRAERPARVVVAVPVAARETCDALRRVADDIVCAFTPEPFHAVGLWYDDFSQTTDDEVHALLDSARATPPAGATEHTPGNDTEHTISLTAGGVTLEGTLDVPDHASGFVLFAHGSGSSRFSPRNRYVARVLRNAGLGTLLLDLLSPAEEQVDEVTRHHRFDIPMLAERLVAAIDWLGERPETRDLPVGIFGASTGGGAALVAAARRPTRVGAVVSRGGRPDLAGDALLSVRAPTLLIVGGRDEPVIALNETAMRRMRAAVPPPDVRLEIVPGATHLFEEPGAIDAVARLASDWFTRQLSAARPHPAVR